MSHHDTTPGLSTASKDLSDHMDRLYISTNQLFTYIAAWEWVWQHFLGSDATPAGVGLDVAVHPRRGLLSASAARAWDNMMVANSVSHISPSFFYSTFICDEAFRPAGRFKRVPRKADEISMQALQYAIVAFASQYASQNPGEWRDDETTRLRRQKDTQIAEAAWMRARDFLMNHSSVASFRMAYALHLFSNTCPPLRSTNANLDVVQDAVFALQTGLRMMDDLATDLLRQQDEELFALGFHNTDGARPDEDIYLRSEPGYRARVERAQSLKDVAENLLWYSAICDAATTSGFGMPPTVRSSTSDTVDIDAMQVTAALPTASVSPPRHSPSANPTFASHPGPMGSLPIPTVHFPHNGFGALPNISPEPNGMGFSDTAMLRFEPDFMMPPVMNSDLDPLTRDWPSRVNTTAANANIASQEPSSADFAWTGPGSDIPKPWNRIAQRALRVSKQVPYILSRFAAAPGDPKRVKEFLNLSQIGVSTQIMIWQRNGNFRACLDDPNSTAADLAEQFQKTWSMVLFVTQVFQPLLDIDPHLYGQMPASAQSMASHLVNQVGLGSLLFLELCSFLEGTPWVQGSQEPSWPRPASLLRAQLDESRELRDAVRRRCALRIGRMHSMVAKQVERTLRYANSPQRESHSSEDSSPDGSGHSGHRGSDSSRSEFSQPIGSSRIQIPLPQDDMIVPALQIHSSRHPVPTHLACVLHISFCALVPDALQEISQYGAASPATLDALDANLQGLQGILDSVISFGPFFHREPNLETLFSTRNWLAPDRTPLALSLR